MRDILVRIPLPFLDKDIPLYSYGFMAMLGFIAAVLVARWRAKRVGASPQNAADVAMFALLGGIIGSRIFYVFQNRAYYFDTSRPDWSVLDFFKLWEGGLVFYGGFIGAVILAGIVMRVRKEKMLPMLDVLAPSLALGHAFGRIGCLMRGCCYGRPTAEGAWWGIRFPENAVPYTSPSACRYGDRIPAGTSLFPTQIVSALDLLIVFGLLSLYFKHRRGKGEVFAVYMMLYSIHRFAVEFFRGDTHLPGVFSSAQWIGLVAFFAGAGLWVYARRTAPDIGSGNAAGKARRKFRGKRAASR